MNRKSSTNQHFRPDYSGASCSYDTSTSSSLVAVVELYRLLSLLLTNTPPLPLPLREEEAFLGVLVAVERPVPGIYDPSLLSLLSLAPLLSLVKLLSLV